MTNDGSASSKRALAAPSGPRDEVNFDELARDAVNLLLEIIDSSDSFLQEDFENSDLHFAVKLACEAWSSDQWVETQVLCSRGVDLCSIWTGQEFSIIPQLAKGVLHAIAGSSLLLNEKPKVGWAKQAMHAFRQSRECMHGILHVQSNTLEAAACLGLAVAYRRASQPRQAVQACAHGLALLPHKQTHKTTVENLRTKLKSLWMHSRDFSSIDPSRR